MHETERHGARAERAERVERPKNSTALGYVSAMNVAYWAAVRDQQGEIQSVFRTQLADVNVVIAATLHVEM